MNNLQNHLLDQSSAFQYFFENHPDAICVIDVDGRFVNVNTSALDMFGYTRKEILQTSLDQILNGSSVNADEMIQPRSEFLMKHKKGHFVFIRSTCSPLISDGQVTGRLLTFEDITQQREQSKELSDIQEMFSFISKKSQNIISSFSPDGVFTYIAPTVQALLGYTPEEVIGKPAVVFNHPDDNARLLEFRNSLFIDQDTVRFTGRVRHKNGEYRWYETTVEYIRDSNGDLIQSICVGRDITDRKEAEEKIAYLAYHDPLTNLPNRRLFKKRVSQLLENKQKLQGLMLIDLDGFKYVNDTYGHEMGDLLLIEVAGRLTQAVGNNGMVARWGGDEFTILPMNIEDRDELISLMVRIKDIISEPIRFADHPDRTLCVNASIGVSFSPEDGDSVDALIKNADAAMYRSKNQTKNQS